MATLILYLVITIIGYFLGAGARKHAGDFAMSFYPWVGRVEMISIAILVLIIGGRIGASEEIIRSLGTIGLKAFAYTLIIMAAAVAAFAVVRRLLGFDRYGRLVYGKAAEMASGAQGDSAMTQRTEPKAVEVTDGAAESGTGARINKFTILIIGFVALGILLGYFVRPDALLAKSGPALTVCLCILLLMIGIDIGVDGTLGENFRRAGWRVLVFPFVSILSMVIGAVVAAPLVSMTLKDSLCIGAGFGWYTLAPAMLAEYSAEVSALSFLHNVFREVLGLLLIPVVAAKAGAIECTAVPGSPAMDVCLPVVEQSAGSTVAVYSFINGAVLSASVPILVSLFLGL